MEVKRDAAAPCEACGGQGWLWADNTDLQRDEIQRCDACALFESDHAAGVAATHAGKAKVCKACNLGFPIVMGFCAVGNLGFCTTCINKAAKL